MAAEAIAHLTHIWNSTAQAETEEWRPIAGWEGLYEVSSLGRVQSLDRMRERYDTCGRRGTWTFRGRILVQTLTVHGYPFVILADKPRREQRLVAHLACAAWYGPRPEGHHTAHFDGCRVNSRPDNLRWALPVDNHADMARHGTRPIGEVHANAKLTDEAVRFIRSGHGLTDDELAVQFGVSAGVVQKARVRATWKHVY